MTVQADRRAEIDAILGPVQNIAVENDADQRWLGVDAQGHFYTYAKPNCFMRLIYYVAACIFCCCMTDEMGSLDRAFEDITDKLNTYLGHADERNRRDVEARYKGTIDELFYIADKLRERGKIHWNEEAELANLPLLKALMVERHYVDLGEPNISHQINLVGDDDIQLRDLDLGDEAVTDVMSDYVAQNLRGLVVCNHRDDTVYFKVTEISAENGQKMKTTQDNLKQDELISINLTPGVQQIEIEINDEAPVDEQPPTADAEEVI